MNLAIPFYGTTVDSRVGSGSVSYTFPADIATGFSSILIAGDEGEEPTPADFVITCGFPSETMEPATPAPPIPPWLQSYGRFGADAACLDGWNQSWEDWAAPVTGGWTCNRAIPSLG